MTPQKKEGLFVSYRHRRLSLTHHHEIVLGDKRLYEWIMDFKPFLKGAHNGKTKPVSKRAR